MRNVLLALAVLVLFAESATTAPVPKSLKKAKPLWTWIEPLPGEKLHSVDWNGTPLRQVMEELEQLSGLMFLSKDTPIMNITLRATDVCVWELFAQLDDILIEEDWLLIRKRQSFSCYSATERIPRMRPGEDAIDVSQLRTQSRHLCRQMTVEITEDGQGEHVQRIATEEIGGTFKVESFGARRFIVSGRVMDLQKFVDEMGDHIKK